MPENNITSAANERIKEVLKLRHRKKRDQSGLTLVDGEREVFRAFEAGVEFSELYVCATKTKQADSRILNQARSGGVSIFNVTKNVFKKISYGDREDGLLGVARFTLGSLQSIAAKTNPLIVLVEGVEKPGNLGAILRSADAAGADGVIVCDGRTDVLNPNVIRASLGTVFTVSVATASSQEAFDALKSAGIRICSAVVGAQKMYTQTDLSGPLAIAVGSEEQGLSKFWQLNGDACVSIPMKGRADSLNVSATTAVLLFEAIRQRNMKP